ncbi:helix-turn-helix domain-containing protein [Paenibacillus nasutitermitis]|uniref:Transcriptional regulator n=1 Tax=Paenibacillus nasutitermitis TaxID=1652958 RepID=A0A916ZAP4_9BACL|nr:helix-turn-helix domain-containing protein [Paenibacillus nasutitermitis]GGD84707.1 transcriptional regulator [Paenibacillus nasutitermitis]
MTKMDLLFHPIRMRIIQKLLLGKPMTIAQLAETLGDIPQATLYRHMKILLDGDHVEVVDTNKVSGTAERIFSIKKESLLIPENEVEATSQEDNVRHFSVFHTNLLQQATSYLMETSPQQYKQDGFAYWQTPLHLTDEEFQELVRSINESMEKAFQHQKTSERTTRMFSGMFIPQK